MATTTCHRVFQTLSRLACGIVAAAALLATNPAPAATLNAFMYGINDNNEIYEVNPVDKTSRLLLIGSSKVLGSTANSVGYDDVRNHLFFLGADSVFRYWSRATNQIQDVQGLSRQTSVDPFNGCYYNDAFYFFEANTNELKKAELSYTGSGETAVPSVTGLVSYAIQGMDATGVNTNTFGDIAIDTATGVLYASTSRGRFYSIDLQNPETSFQEIGASLGNDRSLGLQLSFDRTNNVLYGQRYIDGTWYTVDQTTGATTQIAGLTTVFGGGHGFRDLGGSAVNAVPEPSSIALAAFGIAGGLGYGAIRRRSKARQHHQR
jgi:hypothetical protein